MARRDSVIDVALRSWWARLLVAALTAVVVVRAWIWGFRYFGDELDMEFLAWPVGIGMALAGYLLVGLVYRRFGPKAAPMHLSLGVLSRKLDAALTSLPEISHTVHPLGSPWPKAVIGPAGVYVVEPVVIGASHVGYLDGEIMLDGRPAGPKLLGDTRRMMEAVRELLHDKRGMEVPVYGVIAVDDATIIPGPLQADHLPLRVSPLSRFPEAVDFGRELTPEVVREVAAAIAKWRPVHGRH